jgi:hypothetical protein
MGRQVCGRGSWRADSCAQEAGGTGAKVGGHTHPAESHAIFRYLTHDKDGIVLVVVVICTVQVLGLRAGHGRRVLGLAAEGILPINAAAATQSFFKPTEGAVETTDHEIFLALGWSMGACHV